MFKLCPAHDMDFLCMRCAGKQGRCDGKQVKRTAYITPELNMRLRLPRTCRCPWSDTHPGCHISNTSCAPWLPAACQHAQHTKHRVRQPRIPDWMQTRIPAHDAATEARHSGPSGVPARRARVTRAPARGTCTSGTSGTSGTSSTSSTMPCVCLIHDYVTLPCSASGVQRGMLLRSFRVSDTHPRRRSGNLMDPRPVGAARGCAELLA